MDIRIKSDGQSKGNKSSVVIDKNSNNRKISKTTSKKNNLKGTSGTKSHLPRLKTTQPQKLSSIKDTHNSKLGSSKPVLKLQCSTSKPAKDLGLRNIKPVNIVRPKSTTKSNVNLLKPTTKSVNVYRNTYSSQAFELKGNLKNNDTVTAIKFDNKISGGTKIIGHAAREVITATKELAMLTEADKKISQDNAALLHTKSTEKRRNLDGNRSSYIMGAIPKISKKDRKSDHAWSFGEKSNIENKNGYESKEDEENIEQLNASSSFHRDRIAETLKEVQYPRHNFYN